MCGSLLPASTVSPTSRLGTSPTSFSSCRWLHTLHVFAHFSGLMALSTPPGGGGLDVLPSVPCRDVLKELLHSHIRSPEESLRGRERIWLLQLVGSAKDLHTRGEGGGGGGTSFKHLFASHARVVYSFRLRVDPRSAPRGRPAEPL